MKNYLLTLVVAALVTSTLWAAEKASVTSTSATEGKNQDIGAAVDTGEKITFNYKDTDLWTILNDLSKHMNKTFIVDPTAHGKITVVTPGAVSVPEAYNIFCIALATNGLTTVEDGKYTKIKQAVNAERDNLEMFTEAPQGTRERMVSVAWTLKNVPAREIYNAMGPMLQSRYGEMRFYEDKNILFASDYVSNVTRIQKVIETLDVPGKSKFARAESPAVTAKRHDVPAKQTHPPVAGE